MADRINVTTGVAAGGRSTGGPRAARFIVSGQTQFGPTDAPRIVYSLADFASTYGARSGGANVYDAAEYFFSQGGAELVVQRAFGPSAVKATVSLDAGKITVTSRAPGAFYNAFTAAYTAATNTLTIVKGSRTSTYSTGASGTAADLLSKASNDPDVVVTVSSLPASSVTATALSGGTDDFANVNWATVLGLVTNTVGSGAMAVPGVPAANAALAAAATPRRVALLTPAQTDAVATVVTAQGAIAAANRQNATYAMPWGLVPDGVGGKKVIDGTVYAGTLRSRAITVYGWGGSALTPATHRLVKDFTPLVEVSDAEHTALMNAGVVTIQTLAMGVGVSVWATPEGVSGNPALKGLKYRDITNAVADEGSRALAPFIDETLSAVKVGDMRAALVGVCETAKTWLEDNGPLDPGYKVTADLGAVADNKATFRVALRFKETAEFIDFVIVTASADQTI